MFRDGSESHLGGAEAFADDVFQPDESAAHNEEDFFRIDADVFLLRVLAASGGRNIADGAFNDFQQSLLHAFPGDVSRDGDILCFASDFVDFIHVDDALFRFRYVKVGRLEQAQDDVFHIFPYVTGFRQRGGVHNAEWDVEHFRQRFRQQGFS